nr:MAG TPA: hypothetical protein [Caudoviricetes sp.]
MIIHHKVYLVNSLSIALLLLDINIIFISISKYIIQ